ncbi:endonuclease/exonuclease/phosphatase family protein [Pedobacter sp. MR22-3]|uniref:endonuclease/exonuclease/phosphatase family protein n=1 Tax=Pedobacter sp. MR22-3 TaxID=2994552 RepID=UPI002246D3D2|nr:endonuclease/exonuclease/phosphatase family protein [Pedobacter sp. MR22-3]MCX2585151.1 endonuclease/exonuclease/phosphatase family protein [Pedobacter sp. MR22-3]
MTHDILFYLSLLVILLTVIPFIRHDFWIFRVFEYPRLQKLSLNLVLILIILCFSFPVKTADWLLFSALLLNIFYLLYLIFPFTVFGKKQIITSLRSNGRDNLKILIANVFQENRQSADYHNLIASCNPDVILMVETNKWWEEEMDSIQERYTYQLKAPLENTYGMLLYSKLSLTDTKVNYLVKPDIPSMEATVELRSGQKVKLFCLHPEPPVPQENPKSTERDKEILIVGDKAKESKIPVVVMGDLNDVAWSYTTELFGKVSGLLDPRRGRGFFNSFNAKYWLLRFPLDHIFCSTDFALSSIKRLPSCGSDHFPMCVDLKYLPSAENQNEQLDVSADDLALAKEKIRADG